MSLRRTTAAGLAALALLSVAACGKSHHASSGHSSTSSASASTSATSGVLAQKLQKVFDDGKTAHVTLDLGSTGTGSGDIDFAASKPSLDLTISGGQAGSAEVRLVDGVMYLKSSMAGKKWLKLDAAAAGSSGFDPSKLFDQLKNVKGGTDLGGGQYSEVFTATGTGTVTFTATVGAVTVTDTQSVTIV